MRVIIKGTVVLWSLLSLIFMNGCCDLFEMGCDEEEPSPTPAPAITATPPYSYTSEWIYHIAPAHDGMFVIGWKRPNESEEFFSEPRLWLPWPLETGQTFSSYAGLTKSPLVFTVNSTEDTVTSPAGIFDHAINCSANSGLTYYFYFVEKQGIVKKGGTSGRESHYSTLQSLVIVPGGSEYFERYALNRGNRWDFLIQGHDSNGYPYHINEIIEVIEHEIVNGQEAAILRFRDTYTHGE